MKVGAMHEDEGPPRGAAVRVLQGEAAVRRACLLAAGAALAGTSAAACVSLADRAVARRPVDVVLVHGAWYGGWCWNRLRPLLEQAGCRVHTPTMTGLGDRAHLAAASVDLDLHVKDIQALLVQEDLRDVCLVGHSYGGFVISALARLERERLRSLVYLDAFVPQEGRRVIDYLLPLDRREAIVEAGTRTGSVAPIPPAAFGISDPADLAWIGARVVAQPFRTFTQPIGRLADAGDPLPRAYIACTRPASGSFGQFAQQVRADPSWRYRELSTGHMAMITAPQALAEALLAVM